MQLTATQFATPVNGHQPFAGTFAPNTGVTAGGVKDIKW